MLKRFWEDLSPRFEEAFIDGLPVAITAKSHKEKIFWWIILAAGTLVSAYHCYLILESSWSQTTVTKIQLEPLEGVMYPVLTICDNTGQYNLKLKAIRKLNISDAEIAKAIISLPIQTTEMSGDLLVKRSKQQVENPILSQNNDRSPKASTYLSLVEFAGVTCSDLFQLCQDYNGANISCCDVFAPLFTMNYGLCYAPNQTLMPRPHTAGALSELYIQLRLHQTWDITGSSDKPSLALFFDTGLYQGLFKADLFVLLQKYTLAVWVSVQRVTLSNDSEKCSPSEKLKYFQDYTHTNCMTERRFVNHPKLNLTCQLPILTLIGRGLNFTNRHDNYTQVECSEAEILQQIYNSSSTIVSLTDWQRLLKIAEVNPCPSLCQSISYAFSRVPTKDFQSGSDAAIRLIFTESFHSHVIEVSPLSSWDYLSLIGGTIGLYIGASLISILHICTSLILSVAKSIAKPL